MRNTLKKFMYFAVILVFVFSITACEKDKEADDSPEMPPEDAFVMDFSDFSNNKSQNKSAENVETSVNFGYAALNVGVWNTLLSVGLAVPVTSYKVALDQKPSKTAPNVWEWVYNFDVGSVGHTARLEGTLTSTAIDWKMYISKDGFFEDFVWYTGQSQLDGKHGTWTLYKSPTENVELLDIEWNYDGDTGIKNIKYTNIETGSDANGGYILFGVDKEELNAYYDIYNTKKDETTNIRWSLTNKNGKVKAQHFFSDDTWHCWDTSQNDIDCNM